MDTTDQKYLLTLDEDHPLFRSLRDEPPYWWIFLKKYTSPETPADERLYINIRKDNTIDVYHQGGLLVSIAHNGIGFEFKTHYKYATDEGNRDDSKTYVSVDIDKIATESGLATYLRRIHQYYSQNSKSGVSEKYLQAEIYTTGDYIDTEFAYNDFPFEHTGRNAEKKQWENKSTKDIRIDLLRYDRDQNRLTFVELKREADGRLLCAVDKEKNERRAPEILTQMKAYKDFVKCKQKLLLDYYVKLIKIGQSIGIVRADIDTAKLTFNEDVVLLIQSPVNPSTRRQKRDEEIKKLLAAGNITQEWR